MGESKQTIESVNLDHFLQFWSHHNQTIVQVLIVLTLIFIVALVFITLFGAKEAEEEASGGASLSPEIERTLQKLLENQAATKSAVFDFSNGQTQEPRMQSAAMGPSAASAPATGISVEAAQEIERAKSEIVQREKTIQELKAQLVQASNQATEAKASGGGTELETRIKELEARLAEYDIISEDIADLSRYKEENERLKAQLQTQGAETSSAVEAAPEAPPASTKPVVEPAVEAAPAPEAPQEQAASVAQASESSSGSSAIDDDLMKEFAAAVEGQKAAQTPPAAAATAENEDLMGQFEDFVQKKEGSS